ncbi:hypothetical protein EV360DRAFT_90647 [Lentinula raphanica]|nr:hypothetical protein EV360DRAFT_90647 [Lentinula raphanica]
MDFDIVSQHDSPRAKEHLRKFRQLKQSGCGLLTFNAITENWDQWSPPTHEGKTISSPMLYNSLKGYRPPLCADIANPFRDEEECSMVRVGTIKRNGTVMHVFRAPHHGLNIPEPEDLREYQKNPLVEKNVFRGHPSVSPNISTATSTEKVSLESCSSKSSATTDPKSLTHSMLDSNLHTVSELPSFDGDLSRLPSASTDPDDVPVGSCSSDLNDLTKSRTLTYTALDNSIHCAEIASSIECLRLLEASKRSDSKFGL